MLTLVSKYEAVVIPYGKHEINQNDIEAVLEVLQSDFLTQGPKIPAFEKALTDFTGAKHALAVNSATSALHIACLALGLEKGDWLWTTPVTFVASANCGLYCGAKVDFVDIDPKTYNLSVEALATKLEYAKNKGRLPKVLVVVHLCGQPCILDDLEEEDPTLHRSAKASHAYSTDTNAIHNYTHSPIQCFSV